MSSPRIAIGMVLILLAVGAVPAPATGQAQASAPWWDPPTVRGPEDYQKGWNFRVAIQVTNPYVYAIDATHPITAHLHMNQLAAEAGWLQTTVSGLPVARSFTFDPASVRLVEYSPNWQRVREEIPHLFFPLWLDPDQSERFGRTQTQEFHPRQNPVATLRWLPKEPILPGQSAYYYVYFDATENSQKEAPEFSRLAQERLAGMDWVGRGTEVWGFAQGALTQNLAVAATQPDTSVRVLEYRAGFPKPTLRDLSPLPNPFRLNQAGDVQQFLLSPNDLAFKIEADKPVLVQHWRFSDANRGLSEFVPSLDANLRGTRFSFVAPVAGAFFVLGSPPLDRASIQVQVTQTTAAGVVSSFAVPLTAFNGFREITMAQGARYDVQADAPIVIQPRVRANQGFWSQAPGIETGSPVAGMFYASGRHIGGFGTWRLMGVEEPGYPVVFPIPLADRVFPDPAGPLVRMDPGPENRLDLQLAVPGFPPPSPQQQPFYTMPHVLWSSTDDELLPEEQGRMTLYTGRGGPSVTPAGGEAALRFNAQGNVAIFAHYNATVVRVTAADGTQTTMLMDQDGQRRLTPAGNAWSRIESNKPLSVVPLALGQFGFTRYMPSTLPSPPVQVLLPEFRGYLVEVRSPDGADPIFVTSRPGQAVTVPIQVRNLGQWTGGLPLDDTIRVQAIAPADWGGSVAWGAAPANEVQVTLASKTSRTLELTLTPPTNVPAGSVASIEVRATSQGNPQLRDQVQVILFVEQEFGVQLWWDVGGSTTVKEIARSLEPSTARVFRFFIENTGSGTDSFRLVTNPSAFGWDVRVVDPNNPSRRIDTVRDMQPGERRMFHVLVTSPPEEGQDALTVFLLQAFSESSASTGDILQGIFRLSLHREIRLEADVTRLDVMPGASVEFPLSLENTGRDAVVIRLGLVGQLREGWAARFVGFFEDDPEITLVPSQSFRFGLNLSAPANEPFAQVLPVLVEARVDDASSTRDTAGLVVVVDRLVNFTATAPSQTLTGPGSVVALPVTVAHGGNAPGVFVLQARTLPGGWRAPLDPTVVLGPPEDPAAPSTAEVVFNVTVPTDALAGVYDLSLLLIHRHGGVAEVPFRVIVSEHRSQVMEVTQPTLRIGPSQTVSVPVVLRNVGNALLTFHAEAQAPAGWAVRITPSPVQVDAQRNVTLRLEVEAPLRAAVGANAVSVVVRVAETGHVERAALAAEFNLPDLEVVSLTPVSLRARYLGDVLFLTAIVANRGEAAAESIPVVLRVDGQEVDAVTLERLGPSTSALVTLQMAWPGHVPEVEVAVNPAATIPESDLSNNVMRLAWDGVGTDLGAASPAAGLLGAALALGVAVAVRRRRS